MFDSAPAPAFRLPTALTVARIDEENYRTKTIVLNGALEATPGQFVMAWLPRFDEKPFSLVDNDPITLMVTAVGPFSRLVHALEPGDRLWLRGPFGQGFAVPHGQARLAVVGGGYGVAPLLWLARSLARTGRTVTTIIGARTADDLLYAERFAALARFRPPHATVYDLIAATEDGSRGVQGRVTDALLSLLEAGSIDGIYACGPDPMLSALRELGQRYAIPCQLSWEAYMRCAIGICGACEHEGKVLCLDGPVVRD
ncbi:MAG: dihydroorotate dehydrogenase electron transfer subunit [Caldilineaceae bacterium]|nr:dihydroorotate dehydrogenase electron transfer subunit [Caldilineaceae bacterium]